MSELSEKMGEVHQEFSKVQLEEYDDQAAIQSEHLMPSSEGLKLLREANIATEFSRKLEGFEHFESKNFRSNRASSSDQMVKKSWSSSAGSRTQGFKMRQESEFASKNVENVQQTSFMEEIKEGRSNDSSAVAGFEPRSCVITEPSGGLKLLRKSRTVSEISTNAKCFEFKEVGNTNEVRSNSEVLEKARRSSGVTGTETASFTNSASEGSEKLQMSRAISEENRRSSSKVLRKSWSSSAVSGVEPTSSGNNRLPMFVSPKLYNFKKCESFLLVYHPCLELFLKLKNQIQCCGDVVSVLACESYGRRFGS